MFVRVATVFIFDDLGATHVNRLRAQSILAVSCGGEGKPMLRPGFPHGSLQNSRFQIADGRSVNVADFLDFRSHVFAIDPAFEPARFLDEHDVILVATDGAEEGCVVLVLGKERVAVSLM